jgi:hypothetical protein
MAEIARRLRAIERVANASVGSSQEEGSIVFPDPVLSEAGEVFHDDDTISLFRYARSATIGEDDPLRYVEADGSPTLSRYTTGVMGDDHAVPLKHVLSDIKNIALFEAMAAVKTFIDYQKKEEELFHRLFEWGVEGLGKILDLSADDDGSTTGEGVAGTTEWVVSHPPHPLAALSSLNDSLVQLDFELSDFSRRLAEEAKRRTGDKVRFYLKNRSSSGTGPREESCVAHLKAGGKKILPHVTEVVGDAVHGFVHALLERLEKEQKRAHGTIDVLVSILKEKMVEHREVMAQVGRLCAHCLGGAIATAVLEKDEVKGTGEAEPVPPASAPHAHLRTDK